MKKEGKKTGYIVTGEMLNTILASHNNQIFSVFSQVALSSDVVLCCRVSPKQKQEIVAMVKKAVGFCSSRNLKL
jgi:magnesium-transporting ATPase (P-type)